jgi:hypothetical protein
VPQVVPDAGQFVYVRTETRSVGAATQVHEMWLEPAHGMIPSKIPLIVLDGATMGPGVVPALCAPTNQAILADPKRTLLSAFKGEASSDDPEQLALKLYSEVFGTCGDLFKPTIRQALYQLLLQPQDLQATELLVDGRTLYDLNRPASRSHLLFDQATGRLVGSWVDAKDGRVTGISLWSFTLVAHLGQRG